VARRRAKKRPCPVISANYSPGRKGGGRERRKRGGRTKKALDDLLKQKESRFSPRLPAHNQKRGKGKKKEGEEKERESYELSLTW